MLSSVKALHAKENIFIQSNLNFGQQMAGYWATIEIEVFQLANNGLAKEIILFVWANAVKMLFQLI